MTQSAIDKRFSEEFQIEKTEDELCRLSGWAMISMNKNGEPVYDLQGDHIPPAELVKGAAEFASVMGQSAVDDMHNRQDVGRVVESVVTTLEFQKAHGIPEGTRPVGWWVTVEVPRANYEMAKSGKRPMFSIEARAQRDKVAA